MTGFTPSRFKNLKNNKPIVEGCMNNVTFFKSYVTRIRQVVTTFTV
jgi:hypothetical protein